MRETVCAGAWRIWCTKSSSLWLAHGRQGEWGEKGEERVRKIEVDKGWILASLHAWGLEFTL